MTLTFDILTLKLVRIIDRGMSNPLTNFVVSETFLSRHVGQQLSDELRDLVTMTLDFGGHGAAHDAFEVRRPSNSAVMTHFRFQH